MTALLPHILRCLRAFWLAGCGRWIVAALLLVGGVVRGACADENEELTATKLEYQVKAGFIFNFVKFVEWPTNVLSGDGKLRIGVLGDSQVFNTLAAELSGKRVGGREVEVLHIQLSNAPAGCNIIFVARSQAAHADDVCRQVGSAPVLTIGEFDRFAENGGCINFVRKGDNIRFEVNLAAAERAKLKLSAKLAAMAIVVRGREVAK